MPRTSVIHMVGAALEDFRERLQSSYLAAPEKQLVPTLPTTPDGKINVRALTQVINRKETKKVPLRKTETHQTN